MSLIIVFGKWRLDDQNAQDHPQPRGEFEVILSCTM